MGSNMRDRGSECGDQGQKHEGSRTESGNESMFPPLPHLKVSMHNLVEVHVLNTLKHVSEVLACHCLLDGHLSGVKLQEGREGQTVRLRHSSS